MQFLHPTREKYTCHFACETCKIRCLITFSYQTLAAEVSPKTLLHGTGVAMYIVGQERRLVDPPSQVVAGVRTVTTNMDGRDVLPRLSRPFAFSVGFQSDFNRENSGRMIECRLLGLQLMDKKMLPAGRV